MRGAIIGFVIGIGCLQVQARLPGWPAIAAMLVAALLILGSRRFVHLRWLRLTLPAIGGALLGFAWAALVAQHTLALELPTELEGRDVTMIGTIDSLPSRLERGVGFNFAVEKVMLIDGAAPAVPYRIALSWSSMFAPGEMQEIGKVQPGERWRLTVRLKRPHGNANPYGFDYEAWLLEQNLRATGYVRPDSKSAIRNERLDAFVVSPRNVVERARGWLRERIFEALPDKQYAGVIVALVIGDQRAVDQDDWKIFSRTGIGHLISISGLHITMVAAMCASLMFALWRRSFFTGAGLPARLPAQKAAALAGALAALVYVLLAGWGVPAQRTLYMLLVVAAALWSGRITSVSHVLCIALGVVTLLDPWAVLGPGFWLSFGAVAIILYASVGRSGKPAAPRPNWRRRGLAAMAEATHTQYVVTLGLVPLTVLLFGQISLVSPLANAIAIPLVSFLVTPLALFGSVMPQPLIGWLLGAAHQLVAWLALWLQWLSSFRFAVWSAPMPVWWMFALALCGTLWMLAPRGWPARWLGATGWLPLVLNVPTHPGPDEMWITAFDVGQGMALLVETEKHRLLYDTGPFYSSEADGGNRVVLPYLRGRGIDSLDSIVVSHSDVDHSGGALSVFDAIETRGVLSSLPFEHAVVQAAPGHRRCEAGQAWQWDGVSFEMLHPAAKSYEQTQWKPNARSCTLRIDIAGQSILLPGDIEAAQEAALVRDHADRLPATVLLAPHHGSGTSSTMPFLQAVAPRIALFQVGYRNRYRHPKKEVFERYAQLGIERLRNDASGAITLKFGKGLEVTEYRRTHARYWHGR